MFRFACFGALYLYLESQSLDKTRRKVLPYKAWTYVPDMIEDYIKRKCVGKVKISIKDLCAVDRLSRDTRKTEFYYA